MAAWSRTQYLGASENAYSTDMSTAISQAMLGQNHEGSTSGGPDSARAVDKECRRLDRNVLQLQTAPQAIIQLVVVMKWFVRASAVAEALTVEMLQRKRRRCQ